MFNFFKRKKKTTPENTTPKVPLFEEKFTLVDFKVLAQEFNGMQITQELMESVINTLTTPLIPYMEKIGENPSDQQKAMLELLHQIKIKGASSLGHSEWSYSSGNGIGARIIINGKNRIALLGSAHALTRATTPFALELNEVVQKASQDGNTVFICAVDAVAFAVAVLSHSLVELKAN